MEERDEAVVVYTDGGCQPNPGTGGWGAILQYKGQEKELSGGELDTTNNRMELSAAVAALDALKRPCKVVLYTDSQYLRNGVTTWMPAWRRNGWRRKTGDVKNLDLWQKLATLVEKHTIDWRWVRGHAGNAYNERCDVLASEAIARLRRTAPGL